MNLAGQGKPLRAGSVLRIVDCLSECECAAQGRGRPSAQCREQAPGRESTTEFKESAKVVACLTELINTEINLIHFHKYCDYNSVSDT